MCKKLKVLGTLVINYVTLTNPLCLHSSLAQHAQFGYGFHSPVLGSFQNTQILNQQCSSISSSSQPTGELVHLAKNLGMQVLRIFVCLFSLGCLEILFSDLSVCWLLCFPENSAVMGSYDCREEND